MSRLSNPAGVRINQPHFVHVVSATVRNTRLSYRALGLLVYLLDQKEGWQVRAEQLSKGEGREGREAIRTALRELQVAGHYRLERRRLRNGKCVMGTALSGTPLEQWVRDHEIFSTQKDPAVPVIEQEDGTFLVQYPDGSLGSDGFEPDPYADEEPPADEEPEEPAAAEEPAAEQPPAAPPKKRRPRRTAAQKAADDAEKAAAAEKKAEEKAALDAAADEVAKWWWEDAERHLGKFAGKTNGYLAMRGMVKKALQVGYTKRQCADALRHARQHLPSAQQWQTALGVVTNHIAPKRPTGRVPYSDAATWGTPGEDAPTVPGTPEPTPSSDADAVVFGVIERP
ncbi:helix-turn-helix DNA binding domain protein [Streptomyces phage Gilgamesh]|uniref:Helix-turn-helix DNA binding domain protein n=1 Tax=Streptomyces phage Gilgamesh TaxID=2599890 RepID=A0A5J6TR45_9CAUD|nr:helix-turn-helix DNA binding domain protein [Streptomyces phage Gilgamesh]QFG13273.1 helix-turn-helix DNA binding domain protein [Streptomyces phage Gilgamesh]